MTTTQANYRVFRGSETGQVSHDGAPAQAQAWYFEPADYDGDHLYSAPYQTRRAALEAVDDDMTRIEGEALCRAE